MGLSPTSKDSADQETASCDREPEAGNKKGLPEPGLVGIMETEGSAQEPDVPSRRNGFMGR